MRSFTSWVDDPEKGFFIPKFYDAEQGELIARPSKMTLFPWQRTVFSEALQVDERDHFKYETFIFSVPKKSAKTTVAAAITAWLMEEGPDALEAYCVANSKEQAEARSFTMLRYHTTKRRANRQEGDLSPEAMKYRIEYPDKGSFVQVLSTRAGSVAGAQQALTVWDELWNYSCPSRDAMVLRGDLRWVRADSLQVGDGLLGFEEEKTGYYRSWERSEVLSTSIEPRDMLRLSMAGGRTISVTPEHPFLARRGTRHQIEWIRAGDLHVGDQLMRVLDVWSEEDGFAGGYLAGAFDSEGCLTHNKQGGVKLNYAQKPNPSCDMVLQLLEELGFYANNNNRSRTEVKVISLDRKAEVLRFLGSVRPRRLLPKLDIDRLGRMTTLEWVPVLSSIGFRGEAVLLGTSSHTYLTDGFASHNSEEHRRLWEELTPVPTEPTQLRLIVTYAGFEGESDLLWDLYKMTVLEGEKFDLGGLPAYTSKDGSIFCYWDHEPRMPWQTPAYYDRQARTLRPSQFLRLHRNEWVSTEDTFIDIEWWDKSVEAGKEADLTESILYRPDSPYRSMPISLAVDVGVTRDASAVVGIYYDFARGRIGLACHEIWTPTPGVEVNLEHNVEAYIRRVCKELNVISIVADPTQFKRSMQTLKEEGLPVEEFTQSVTGMQAATAALYEQLKHGILEAYPDDQIRTHLQFARAKIQNGKARIVKDDKVPRPVDAAVALAMAVLSALEGGGVDTREEIIIRSPFSANTGLKYPAEDFALPPMFRS